MYKIEYLWLYWLNQIVYLTIIKVHFYIHFRSTLPITTLILTINWNHPRMTKGTMLGNFIFLTNHVCFTLFQNKLFCYSNNLFNVKAITDFVFNFSASCVYVDHDLQILFPSESYIRTRSRTTQRSFRSNNSSIWPFWWVWCQ